LVKAAAGGAPWRKIMVRILRLLLIAAAFAAGLIPVECLALRQVGMAVNGQPRSYLMERPAASGPLPTMIVLHGLGGSAEKAALAPGAATIRPTAQPVFAQSQVQSAPPAASAPIASAPAASAAAEEEVTFPSNGYMLAGCIVRPAGPGPFPAVIYNHGSEKDPRRCGPPELARAYVEHGYAFFAFQRHGHGQSPGDYIVDLEKRMRAEASSPAARGQSSVALHEAYNRDVVGAVEWLMRRPEIDRRRVAMTGVSYGGIQTLLTAEKGLGIRAFIPFAPGAMSWANQALDQRLAQAARNAKAPLFLAQAQNDFSLGPSQVLGPIIRAKGAPNDAKVYPPNGTTHEQGHGGFAVRGGIPAWGPDVFGFLDRVMQGAGGAATR
jgi:carboxymethylenebutenolidase